MPQVASMGAAVSVVDVDRDGLADLYVTEQQGGLANQLFRNRGDGTFEDVAERLGVADLNRAQDGVSMGAVWGDYDNDGFDDLFLYRWGRPSSFTTTAARRSRASPSMAGLPAWANINTAVWLDFDRDGRLDLFVGGYYPESVNLWKLADTRMMPESFEYANNGGRKYLFRNLGGGAFEEVSAQVGLASRRWALAAVAADLRGTGYPDLFIANDYGVSELFVNEGGRFREIGRDAGVGYAPKSGMNAVGRRRAQPGPLRDLRLEHLGGRHPAAGQQPLGAVGRRGRDRRSTRTSRARWASISAAGASARSSPI